MIHMISFDSDIFEMVAHTKSLNLMITAIIMTMIITVVNIYLWTGHLLHPGRKLN